eukprot:Amastigsp_a630_315.p5 type:complete len:101 gc:universal Amastigsp_a630_315:245-547(+)
MSTGSLCIRTMRASTISGWVSGCGTSRSSAWLRLMWARTSCSSSSTSLASWRSSSRRKARLPSACALAVRAFLRFTPRPAWGHRFKSVGSRSSTAKTASR